MLNQPSDLESIAEIPADTQIRVFVPSAVFPSLVTEMQEQLEAARQVRDGELGPASERVGTAG